MGYEEQRKIEVQSLYPEAEVQPKKVRIQQWGKDQMDTCVAEIKASGLEKIFQQPSFRRNFDDRIERTLSGRQ